MPYSFPGNLVWRSWQKLPPGNVISALTINGRDAQEHAVLAPIAGQWPRHYCTYINKERTRRTVRKI